jgi:hypothetical protein
VQESVILADRNEGIRAAIARGPITL